MPGSKMGNSGVTADYIEYDAGLLERLRCQRATAFPKRNVRYLDLFSCNISRETYTNRRNLSGETDAPGKIVLRSRTPRVRALNSPST